jgi:hypothetical protein
MFWAAERAIRYKPREARGLFLPARSRFGKGRRFYPCRKSVSKNAIGLQM